MHHFYATEFVLWWLPFRSFTIFFEKYLNFGVFLSVPHLVDNYNKIVDERGRNLLCDRTLPSLLVVDLWLNHINQKSSSCPKEYQVSLSICFEWIHIGCYNSEKHSKEQDFAPFLVIFHNM